MPFTRARLPTTLFALILSFALVAAACGSSDDSTNETTDGTVDGTDDDTVDDDDDADTDEQDTVETTKYSATIRRTTNNVPHIIADDFPSVGFGYGYAFAEDHLCSLADVIVRVNSEAAKYHGADAVAADVVYAAFGLKERSRVDFDALDGETQEVIAAYAAGYNAYLAETGADAVGGWCAGAEWIRPIDEYDLAAYYKALTLRASLDPLIDLVFNAEPPAQADDTGDDEAAESDPAEVREFALAVADLVPEPETLGSNAWAIGPDRTVDGTTMLVGNPHFPWQGALRFYEVHLTVPGEIDVYGVSLLGSPAVNIGFNEAIAWSHTVSAGTRFTAYTLDLVDGSPTEYHYGDDTREMTSVDVTIDVLDTETGAVEPETHTIWFSHYGPILAFPGLGWSESVVITIRDANADNDEIIPQFLAMNRAASMDEFIAAHADNQGIPWVNTIAASADGRIWYADTSATPNMSDAAIAIWQEKLETDLFTQVAADNQVFLFDGSDPMFEWVDAPGARDPGLVPFSAMPQLERTDFVFNANDPNWIANPEEPILGVSPLHGRAEQQLSNRTRMNAIMLAADTGDSGSDGLYTFDELASSALGNRVLTAELLLDEVLAWCDSVSAPPADACDALGGWDRHVNLDSTGAHVWREFIHEIGGDVWAVPFDPTDPINTPRGLTGLDADGTDPVAAAMDAATERIRASGFAFDAPLGEIQFADRGGLRVPIHGGTGTEGVSNVVGFGTDNTTNEPSISRGDRVADSGALTTDGYSITQGTSFIYVLEFTADGPVAQALLTYGETGDSTSPYFSDQTIRFSEKDWRQLAFTEAAIAADAELRTYTVTG